MRQHDVVLVVPPFASSLMPAIGVSILKSSIKRSGHRCRIVYANLNCAQKIGFELYERISNSDVRYLYGDRIFAKLGVNLPGSALPSTDEIPKDLLPSLVELQNLVQEIAAVVVSYSPKIVGFSSTFQQNVASLAISREVRRLDPSIIQVIGGANMEKPMGDAFSNLFPHDFDHIFSGEADTTFPQFCSDVLSNESRNWSRVVECVPAASGAIGSVQEYFDYFEDPNYVKILAQPNFVPTIPFELSRGCWWGQKQHCTFCGLNAVGIEFRQKSPANATSELNKLLVAHSPKRVFLTDNIAPRWLTNASSSFIEDLIGECFFFIETKSNLRDSELDGLVKSRIFEIQPGIESLCTQVLKRIRKGNTGAKHVCFLRDAQNRQIHVSWNFLVDVPGEKHADYVEFLKSSHLFHHLPPPSGCTPIRIDRYSPYFDSPSEFGICNLRTYPAQTGLYGAGALGTEAGYFFEGDYDSEFRKNPDFRQHISRAIQDWIRAWNCSSPPVLSAFRDESGQFTIVRAGSSIPSVTLVEPFEEDALFSTRQPLPTQSASAETVRLLSRFVDAEIVAIYEGFYIFLPTEPTIGFLLRDQRNRSNRRL